MNDNKTCSTCEHGYRDELNDLICVCDKSEYVADYVDEDGSCECWEE